MQYADGLKIGITTRSLSATGTVLKCKCIVALSFSLKSYIIVVFLLY